MWNNVTGWLAKAVDDLTGWMPDFVKNNLGLGNLQIPSPAVPAAPAGGGEALAMAQQREERKQEMLRAQASVYFDNVPPNARVDSQGFAKTTVVKADDSLMYRGLHSAGYGAIGP
jgi:hypothetical protein